MTDSVTTIAANSPLNPYYSSLNTAIRNPTSTHVAVGIGITEMHTRED